MARSTRRNLKPVRILGQAAPVVLVLLCTGCEEGEEPAREPKPDIVDVVAEAHKGSSFNWEERSKKLREQIQTAQKKALEEVKKQEEKATKESKKKAEKEDPERFKNVWRGTKDKDAKPGDNKMVVTSDGQPMVEVNFDPKKKKEDQRRAIPIKKNDDQGAGSMIVMPPRNEKDGARRTEVKPGENETYIFGGTRDKDGKERTDSKIQVLEPGSKTVIEPTEQPKKRSFWDRLFGREKTDENRQTVGFFNPETDRKPGGAAPSDPGAKASMLDRIKAEMAVQRLKNQLEVERDPKAPPKKASLVDLAEDDAERETAADHPQLPATPGLQVPNAAPRQLPENLEELLEALDKELLDGLASKDLVAREYAYRYAAMHKRYDAIPFMVNEVANNGLLAVMAASGLGVLGRNSPPVDAVLLKGLQSEDATMRRTCAESLGALRSRAAVKPMLELVKTEKNYLVRGDVCDALGRIGDTAALDDLRARTRDKNEVEIVRARALLATARLGDRSGKEGLIGFLNHPHPALQAMGLSGLAQLGGPDLAGYLMQGLSSDYDEIWVAAAYYFPSLGPDRSLPLLKQQMFAAQGVLRRRAALTLGLLGSDEGVAFIDEALRSGNKEERKLAARLLGLLGRRDEVPLLIESLKDAQADVRLAASISLAQLNAKDALPALMSAAQGAKAPQDLPPGLRGAMPEVSELLVHLNAIRILRGETDELVLSTLPDRKSLSWPEYDRELFTRQLDLVKSYQVVDVLGDGRPVGVVLKDPTGKELPYKDGELVAAGFRIRQITPATKQEGKEPYPPFVTLVNGDTFVTLIAGKAPNVRLGKSQTQGGPAE
ncbi:MAG: HEAT repeat domain-containing protein [Planctomycetes bacterium]|nr:HEAT repeat domain-containing protein [Planctomycetota bacterium]